MTRMTIKQAKAALQQMGMTLRHSDGEFRVAHIEDGNDSERCASYASTLEDAYYTAVAMWTGRNEALVR